MAIAFGAQAADIAVLHNGFTIRHERRQVMGQITRLYPDNTSGSFVDVPTADIDHFEKDQAPAPAPPPAPATTFAPAAAPRTTPKLIAPSPQKTQNFNEVINSISDQHKIDPDLNNSVIHAESGFNPRAVSPREHVD